MVSLLLLQQCLPSLTPPPTSPPTVRVPALCLSPGPADDHAGAESVPAAGAGAVEEAREKE